MPIIDLAGLPNDERARLQCEVAGLRTLGDVLDWARSLEPPVASPEVVTQDEYTHDVLVAIAGGRYLDFDTT